MTWFICWSTLQDSLVYMLIQFTGWFSIWVQFSGWFDLHVGPACRTAWFICGFSLQDGSACGFSLQDGSVYMLV